MKVMKKIPRMVREFNGKIYDFYLAKIHPFIKKVTDRIAKYIGLKYLSRLYQERLTVKSKKAVTGYLFILPWIIGLIIFGLQPVLKSIRMSFSDFSGVKAVLDGDTARAVFIITGVSTAQFKQIFSDNPEHVQAILSVLGDVLVVVPLVLVFSLILSLLLNKKIRFIKIFRMIFFIPVILLSGNLLNYFNQYNLLTVPALTSSELRSVIEFYLPTQIADLILSAFSKVVLILWLGGVQTLIFLAGLQKTDKPIYESAAIDGASKWEIFWKITFPALMPLMIINIVYTTVIYSNLGNQLSSIISSSIVAPDYGRDYASALAWVLFGIELVVIGIYVALLKLANMRYR